MILCHRDLPGQDWCLYERGTNKFPAATSWVIVTQQLAARSGFGPCHSDGRDGPTQLFLKGAGPGPRHVQSTKVSVKNYQNVLRYCLEGEKKEKGGETPFMTVWSVPGQAGGGSPAPRLARSWRQQPLLWLPCGVSPFGNQQPAKQVSSEACLLNCYRKLKGAI